MQRINASTHGDRKRHPSANKKTNEQTGQTPTQSEARLSHSSSGQDPKAMGSDAGNAQAASRNENERTNRPDTQNRSPTLPRQLRPRPKKATAKQRETEQATSANANEQEQTRTNKRHQSPVKRREEQQEAGPAQGRVTKGHREQGRGQLLGNRHDGWALPGPSDPRSQGTRQRPTIIREATSAGLPHAEYTHRRVRPLGGWMVVANPYHQNV